MFNFVERFYPPNPVKSETGWGGCRHARRVWRSWNVVQEALFMKTRVCNEKLCNFVQLSSTFHHFPSFRRGWPWKFVQLCLTKLNNLLMLNPPFLLDQSFHPIWRLKIFKMLKKVKKSWTFLNIFFKVKLSKNEFHLKLGHFYDFLCSKISRSLRLMLCGNFQKKKKTNLKMA